MEVALFTSLSFRSREYETYTGQNPYFSVTMATPTGGSLPYDVQGADIQEDRVLHQYHVSPSGSDSNQGTATFPFLTVSKALTLAQNHQAEHEGTKIYVADGEYRESLEFTSPSPSFTRAPIIIESGNRKHIH